MFELTNIRRKTKRQRLLSLALAGALSFVQIAPAHALISNTVTARGEYFGTVVTDTDSYDVDVVDAAPSMLVNKTALINDTDGSSSLSDGDVAEFTITLENNGNVSIDTIGLVDTLEQNGTPLTLTSAPVLVSGDATNPGVLDVGEVWTYQASYAIQQANIDDGNDLDNTAAFTGNSPSGPVSGQDDVAVSLAGFSDISLDKAPVSASFARPGDVVTWQLTVTNTGDTTLSAMTVTDDYADTLSCAISSDATIATLAPGAIETCTATYTILAADIASTPLTNTATVSGTGGGVIVSDTATADLPREDANLVTVKSITNGGVGSMSGDTITYEIVVTNAGTADATNISLTDLLPAGLTATVNNGTVTAGSYDSVSGIWTIPSLLNGTNATLTLEGIIDPGQAGNLISNVVSAAESDENDPTTVGDVLTVIFTPIAVPIIAVDDTLGAPIDGAYPLTNVINVFDGDTLAGAPVDSTTVTPTVVGTWPPGFSLNPDGSIDIAGNVPSATYMFDYQICEIADPDNCSIATVTIPIVSSIPRLAGTVFEDNNQNGTLDGTDTPVPGYIVELVRTGIVIATTTTDSLGEYEFTGFIPGTYDVVFIDPVSDIGVGLIQTVVVGPNDNIVDQDLPIDPSGVVYSSLYGTSVAGAIVTIVDGSGNPLPNACLLRNQQSQVTGADGEYRFDIIPGADPACPASSTQYSLEITQPSGYLPLPSAQIPPQAGILDPSVCVEDAIPGGACNLHTSNTPAPVSTPSPYYLDFLIGAGDPGIVFNHIPIDRLLTPGSSGLTIAKTSGVATARLGDTIAYTITITNTLSGAFSGVVVSDTLPEGTLYLPGSATVGGVPNEPAVAGRNLTFTGLNIPGSGSVDINLTVRFGQQVSGSELVNIAYASDSTGNQLTDIARAIVRIEVDPVFACSTIVGRVFDDLNRNGYPDDGEIGLAGVRLATVKGLLITTDEFGRYSIPCAELPDADIGSNFILKLDERTLPTGYRVTSENPRTVRVTAGKMTNLNFGAAISRVVRIDLSGTAFAVDSEKPSPALDRGINQLVRSLETEPSVLRLTYYDSGEGNELARDRLDEVEKLVRQRLRRSRIGVDLWIEKRVVTR